MQRKPPVWPSFLFPFVQVTVSVRLRTVQPAVRLNACSCWCSRSACAGRPGGTSALPISGCPTEKPDAATATAACPVKAPWTWTLTIRCGNQTSRLTWSLSLSWPEPSEPKCWGMDSKMCKALGFTERYILREWIGRRWHRTVSKVSCAKRKSKFASWLAGHMEKKKKKRLPADLNPILSFTVDLVKSGNKSNRTFFWCLDLDRQQPDLTVYKTFYGMITETVCELEHTWIQWVVVVFSDFVF